MDLGNRGWGGLWARAGPKQTWRKTLGFIFSFPAVALSSPGKSSIFMKTKEDITGNWLVRYTKMPLEQFGEHILLTNFNNYVDLFCEAFGVPMVGFEANMRAATAEGITMINFGMGSPNAALIMDLLSSIRPKACLFLGKCAKSPRPADRK